MIEWMGHTQDRRVRQGLFNKPPGEGGEGPMGQTPGGGERVSSETEPERARGGAKRLDHTLLRYKNLGARCLGGQARALGPHVIVVTIIDRHHRRAE